MVRAAPELAFRSGAVRIRLCAVDDDEFWSQELAPEGMHLATESTRSTAATDLADAIEAMAARLQHDPTEILNEVAEGAVAAVPRAIGALIAERRADGQLHEVASAGQVPRDFISVQNELGAGPLTSVMAEGSLLVVEDASKDPRWPSFASSAVRGLLCAPLALGGRLIGALSLISSGVDGFDNESEDMAVILAAHAAVSLAG